MMMGIFTDRGDQMPFATAIAKWSLRVNPYGKCCNILHLVDAFDTKLHCVFDGLYLQGIYDMHIHMQGVPILDWEPPAMTSSITAK